VPEGQSINLDRRSSCPQKRSRQRANSHQPRERTRETLMPGTSISAAFPELGVSGVNWGYPECNCFVFKKIRECPTNETSFGARFGLGVAVQGLAILLGHVVRGRAGRWQERQGAGAAPHSPPCVQRAACVPLSEAPPAEPLACSWWHRLATPRAA